MKIKELNGKKIAILGYGKEGKSTEKFLKKLGINDYKILDKSISDDYLDNLDSFDVIFKTPGISPYNNLELLKVSKKLTSQAEILANNFDGKIIGITGTKGKSTISTLLYKILKEFGAKVKLVGNIGNPVLDEVDIISGEKYDYLVYELSSYMLEGLELNIFVGLLNNIYDCHLDWHNGRKNYENAKFNIFKNAKYKLAGEELKEILKGKFKDIIYFSNNLEKFGINKDDIALKGDHNYKNISGILNILKIINKNFNLEKTKKVLREFSGLAHRQENIGTYKGIIFIDDAIAVTQESTIAALDRYGEKIGTIFLGGVSTGVDYTKLVNSLKKYKIKNVVLFPDSGEEIKKYFGDYNPNILETKSMKEAVKFGYKNTKKGEYCVLSSAAQSFSLWKNFIEKGELFKKYIKYYGNYEKNI